MAARTVDEAFETDASPSVVETSAGHLVLTILMSMLTSEGGTVPKELWGLSRALDLAAPRGFVIDREESFRCYCQRYTEAGRYPIVRLRTEIVFNEPILIQPGISSVSFGLLFNCPLEIPVGVKKLKLGQNFNHPSKIPVRALVDLALKSYTCYIMQALMLQQLANPVTHLQTLHAEKAIMTLQNYWNLLRRKRNRSLVRILPPGLEKLELDGIYFNHPLILPESLRKLTLSSYFNHPITFPDRLEYVKIRCLFNQQLTLPPALKVLKMRLADAFNHPLLLPDHLQRLSLSDSFNHPITLPNSLHTATIGSGFRDSITFGSRLRSLTWLCNHPLHPVPHSLKELVLGAEFRQPLDLGEGLETVMFRNSYNLPLILPSTLKVIYISERYALPLVLPAGCLRQKPPIFLYV